MITNPKNKERTRNDFFNVSVDIYATNQDPDDIFSDRLSQSALGSLWRP